MANIPIPTDFNKTLYTPLAELDPEVQSLIDKETWRQFSGLELIASENLTSLAAMEANGSILTNKYSEGLPGARYYGGNEHIDVLEELCQKRALEAHKTLRGPRAGLIFFRKDRKRGTEEIEARINAAVFPGCQGGPHNNTIAAIAVSLKLAAQPEFVEYAKQVITNAKVLASELVNYGYNLQTDGTDNHLVLWDLRPIKLTGSKVEKIGDLVGITVNTSAQVPGGIRLGTSALTSRSMGEPEMKKVAEFLHRAVQLSLSLQKEAGSKLLKDFVRVATTGDGEGAKGVRQLRHDVHEFARSYPLPGVDVRNLKRPEGLEDD
ncbi:Serine hydroxymethyltransferase, cytosolic [Tulasnella sp. 419]|nr:Serine hydroxymethyltransferase, cytosolic [Tulasnella sp. 419]